MSFSKRLPPVVPDLDKVTQVKGRGTAWRIDHRFETVQREAQAQAPWDEDGTADMRDVRAEMPSATGPSGARVQARALRAEPAARPITVVREEQVKSILSRNNSPDVPFDVSLNPYRGCEHGCIYCYARPTHSYLNLSPGLDFETQLVAKVNAAERLRHALSQADHVPSPINIGAVTDAYQPIERQRGITRQVLEVLLEARHPCTIVTKSANILRDLDLLTRMAKQRLVIVFISVTSLQSGLSRILEPRASAPARRLEAIRALSDAGVWVGVNVAPVIPFINEAEIEQILAAAAEAGARSAHWTVVRLPWEVNPLFQQWLQDHFPDRADRVMARIRDMRGGRDYDAEFSQRMKGSGTWAALIRQRLEKGAARVGLVREVPACDISQFRAPSGGQSELF